MDKIHLVSGSLLGGLSVLLGAFGAHALKGAVSEYYLQVFETACRYQMYHALALLFVGLSYAKGAPLWMGSAGALFLIGTLLFSGSLYLLVLTKIKILGAITPLGGLCLILGWVSLGVSFLMGASR